MGIPTVLGVLFILFSLFFWIAKPEHIAVKALGEKARAEQIEQWEPAGDGSYAGCPEYLPPTR